MDDNAHIDRYEDMRAFVGFTDRDAANLVALSDIVAEFGPGITEAFYAALGAYPPTAKIVEGRIEPLKRTHNAWMLDLTNGEYGIEFFQRQFTIGEVHVRVNIDPSYVEAVMSLLRLQFHATIMDQIEDGVRAGELYGSICRVLDLSLMIINLSYQDERIARISGFTGMSRRLIEKLVKHGKRAS